MAEIKYQNPAAGNVNSQLESRLIGTADDGSTEVRIQVVSVDGLLEVLEGIREEIKQMKIEILDTLR